jgi:hypothetical protein
MQNTLSKGIRTTVLAALLGAGALGCGGDDSSGGGTLTAVTGVKAELLPGPAVHVTWADLPNEHHYTVQRKVGAGEWKALPTVNFNILQYHDADVMAGSYTYRVAGGGKNGEMGPFSAEVAAAVP